MINAVFENVPEKFLRNAKDFSSMCKSSFNLFFKIAPPKCFPGRAQCLFDKFSENFPPVDWQFFGQPPEKILRSFSSSKFSFGHIECSPDNHNERKNFRQKSGAYSFSVRKRLKLLFQTRVLSLKISLWPHIRQLWQIWLKIFA